MDISQLRTLIYVAELGSLSKAADRLRIAQPALSRQIRLLEQELGNAAVRSPPRRGMTFCVTRSELWRRWKKSACSPKTRMRRYGDMFR
ncbi:LysR family transcriptional regulator [Brucella melitensis]|uniref:LysR family transcriptional regulator n=1 Tax=Brucella melitensis TaxID=29459 RepID=UPI0009B6BDED|nr:LysR family transcriptional regulator [Brucella melitensis]AUS48431.1 hypothetical protein C0R52_13900 [Brucella melitensis]